MESTLLPGHVLLSGSYLESDDKRFQLHMRPDGHLVLYAFLSNPVKRNPVWVSHNHHWPGSYVHLHAVMDPRGTLEVWHYDKNTVRTLVSAVPETAFHKPDPGHSQPGAWLEVRSDGHVIITGPGTAGAHWSRPAAPPDIKGAVIPNAGTIFVPPGALSLPANMTIMNDSTQVVGVSDGDSHKTLVPGQQADIFVAGALNVNVTRFSFDPSKDDGISADVSGAKQYGPATKVIRVADLPGAGGFLLS